MNITEMCLARRDAVLPRWVEGFFAAYPLESTGFLRTSSDPFANPVGKVTHEAVAVLYDAVAGADLAPETVRGALESLMRLRGVQDMAPSRAVGPLHRIKSLLRSELLPAWLEEGVSADRLETYFALEDRVDSLVLMALDLYAGAREKVFNIRVEEVKRSQSQVVRWAKLRETADDAGARNRKSEG